MLDKPPNLRKLRQMEMGLPTDNEFSQNNLPEVPPPQEVMQDKPIDYPTSPNPFADAKYSAVNVPDTPINYGGGMAETLLNDNEVPDEVKKKYWYIFHKDNTLTFLDYYRKASKLMNFDIVKIDILNSTPYYDYTFEKELEFTVMRNVLETKLDRALGFMNSNFRNERTVLQSQFQEQRMISEQAGQSPIKESFFKRLMSRR